MASNKASMVGCADSPPCGEEDYIPPVSACLTYSDKSTNPWCLTKTDGTRCHCGYLPPPPPSCGTQSYWAGGHVIASGPPCTLEEKDEKYRCNCNSGSSFIVDGVASWNWFVENDSDHKAFYVSDPETSGFNCANTWQVDQRWLGHARLTCQ